ncbi:MAG: hypothetical protein NT154_01775, partial [Verrucomicrobia bacterium]|nr:hypothetical protein [Verrucomicrobiota bacterium]
MSKLFKPMNLMTMKGIQAAITTGVRPSSGAVSSISPSVLENTKAPLLTDVAAPEDGRTPAQLPPGVLLTRCVFARALRWGAVAAFVVLAAPMQAQTLINVDFGVGMASSKTGIAATGMGTNDYWNLYRHYQPKFTPGMALVADGKLDKLKLADGSESGASVAVNNAPGVWGNSSGDPMYDTYIFAQNGSNLTVTVTGLAPGRYHFYCYGHADPDVTGEQNSVFALKAGTNSFGPFTQMGGSGWKAGNPWLERAQYVVFRDVPV